MPLNIIPVDSFDDPLLVPYRNLRERTLRGESAFIAEGRLLTERLLDSPFETESLLTWAGGAAEFSPSFAAKVKDIPVYTLPRKEDLSQIAGFPFHQGILAAGRRKQLPDFSGNPNISIDITAAALRRRFQTYPLPSGSPAGGIFQNP